MTPNLTFAQLAALQGRSLPFVLFVYLGFTLPTEKEATVGWTRYLCSALRDFPWNGHTWRGMGAIASMKPIIETTNGEQTGTQLSLPAVTPDLRAMAMQEAIQGTECKVWVGLLDQNEQLIDDPVQEYRGTLDLPTIRDNADDKGKVISAELSITVEGLMVDFARTGRFRSFTHADQQEMYPEDMFFEHVGSLKEKALGWGVPGGPT